MDLAESPFHDGTLIGTIKIMVWVLLTPEKGI
jgi:hypothetical protein